MEKGQRAEENQVSRTSSSWCRARSPQVAHDSGVVRETVAWPLGQYQAGIWCPHQSWREMHQSWMLRIHAMYVLVQPSGMKRVRPSSTAAMAGRASGSIFTYHWSERSGSSTVSQRWQRPSGRRWAFAPRSSPFPASAALTAFRASKRSMPWKGPASAVMRPSGPMTDRRGSAWRCATSKSLKSCAGVTFTAPVPNFGSTSTASATTGNSRPVSGWRTFLPTTARQRSSSGCTAMAVSPSMVSGRVVATTISPDPSASGYAKLQSSPGWFSSWFTSRSESAVWQRGHQLMSFLAR